MKQIKFLVATFTLAGMVCGGGSDALALRQLMVSPDPVNVPVSIDAETIIQMPSPIIRVLLPNDRDFPYDMLKPMGPIMVVRVPKNKRNFLKSAPKPYAISVITKKRVQQMVLIPTPGLPQRVEFIEKVSKAPQSFDVESGGIDAFGINTPYERLLRKIIKALYDGVPPKGYRMSEATSDPAVKLAKNNAGQTIYYEPPQFTADYRMDLKRIMVSSKVVGRLYIVSNTTSLPIRLTEQAFWRPGCMAVAIRRHRLYPRTPTTERTGQYQTEVYIVARRSDADVGKIGAKVGGVRK